MSLYQGAGEAVAGYMAQSAKQVGQDWDRAGRSRGYKQEFFWPSIRKGEFPRALAHPNSTRPFDVENGNELEETADYLRRGRDFESLIYQLKIEKQEFKVALAELAQLATTYDAGLVAITQEQIAQYGNYPHKITGEALIKYFEKRLVKESKSYLINVEDAAEYVNGHQINDPTMNTPIHPLCFTHFTKIDLTKEENREKYKLANWCNLDAHLGNDYYWVHHYRNMKILARNYGIDYKEAANKQQTSRAFIEAPYSRMSDWVRTEKGFFKDKEVHYQAPSPGLFVAVIEQEWLDSIKTSLVKLREQEGKTPRMPQKQAEQAQG